MKKLLSLILALVLIITALPTLSFAEDSTSLLLSATDIFSMYVAGDTLTVFEKSGNKTDKVYGAGNSRIIYKFDFTDEMSGKIIDDAVFTFSDECDVDQTLDIYVVPAYTDKATVDIEYYNTVVAAMSDSSNKVATVTTQHSGMTSYTAEANIADAVKTAVAAGKPEITLAIKGYKYTHNFYNNNSSLAPSLALTLSAPASFELVSQTPENGATIESAEAVSLAFNNDVAPASVTPDKFVVTNSKGAVAVSEDEISVSGTTVTLAKKWQANENYTVTLSDISDISGQTLSAPCTVNFKTVATMIQANCPAIAVISMYKASADATELTFDTRTNKVHGAYNYHPVYKFDLSGLDATKQVVSAKFTWWDESSVTKDVNIYAVPAGTWTDRTGVDVAYYDSVIAAKNDPSNLVATVARTYEAGSGNVTSQGEADVTSAVQQALTTLTGASKQVALSFDCNFTAVNNHYLPTSSYPPALVVTLSDPTSVEFKSSYPENGATIGADEAVSFTFSNAIAPATVTPESFKLTNFLGEEVEVSADEIEVSGPNVILNKQWDAYSSYTVALSGISDTFGQTIDGSCSVNFNTSAGEVSETTFGTTDVFSMNKASDATEVKFDSRTNKVHGAYDYHPMYMFEVSGIDDSKLLASAEFTWVDEETLSAESSKAINVYVVPNGTGSTRACVTADYYDSVIAAKADSANAAATVYRTYGPGTTQATGSADVTSAVMKALQSQSGDTRKVTFSFDSYDSVHNHYTTGASLKLSFADPSFDVVASVPEKGGVASGLNSTVEMTLATVLDPATANEDYIKLVKVGGGEVAATVEYAEGSTLLKVTPVDDLEEKATYKVVFVAGIKDAFGNILDADKTIYGFKTPGGIEILGIKFTSDEAPIYNSCEEIDGFAAGDSVTAVAKVINNTGEDMDAVLFVVVYGENNEIIAADLAVDPDSDSAVANRETQFTKTVTVPANAIKSCVKAFVWDNLDTIKPLLKHEIIEQK